MWLPCVFEIRKRQFIYVIFLRIYIIIYVIQNKNFKNFLKQHREGVLKNICSEKSYYLYRKPPA